MKKLLYIILSCLILTACELETPNNGKLDGNWQLRQIDTLATRGTCDMSYSYIYWAVESHLLQVRDIDNKNQKILFRFEKQGDELMIHSPHFVQTKDELIPLKNDSLLTPLGIVGIKDTFLIEKLNHEHLILRNQRYQLHFRRY